MIKVILLYKTYIFKNIGSSKKIKNIEVEVESQKLRARTRNLSYKNQV